MKYKEIRPRPHLLVPVLAATQTRPPISCYDSLVYGYLVFLSKKGNSSTRSAIAKNLRLDRASTNRSLNRLSDLGLVRLTSGRIEAMEPTGTAHKLFMYRTDAAGDWQGRFVYDRVWLPEKPSDLPVRANLLFWRLYRLGYSVKGMPDHYVVGGNPKRIPSYLTAEYLSRSIQCDPKTVRSALKRLERLGLVRVLKREQGFVIGILPLGDKVTLWRKRWTERKTHNPVSIQELFLAPTKSEIVEDHDPRKGILTRFRAYGISGRLAEELAGTILDEQVPAADWIEILEKCSTDHSRNKEKGKTKHSHCGFLFKYSLQEFLENREARRAAAAPYAPRSLADINVDNCIRDYRADEQAERLLRLAIRAEHLEMADGKTIPCSLHAEQVVEIANQHTKDWDGFKTAVAKSVFDGDVDLSSVRCKWLQEWLQAEQVPTEDDSPLEEYSVPTYERSAIRSRIKNWVWDSGCDSTTRAITRTNRILKLACWQSGCFKDTEVHKRVLNAVDLVIDGLTTDADGPDDVGEDYIRIWTAPERTARLGRAWRNK